MDHVRRLVAVGVEYDRPDTEGLTPVQVAGWEGLPDVMEYLLSSKPDLTHVNGYSWERAIKDTYLTFGGTNIPIIDKTGLTVGSLPELAE